ncbi:MAG: protein-L-isoaspartate(D-aspartate) O-methyltransferase [Anaerolineales bacterium]|nr:protein-L-isoaspartate(D-aspartate) O-methyltransferase [Anaerolineales bacterium]
MSEADQYSRERRQMVQEQLIARGIKNPRVIDAMLSVPRHLFVPDEYRDMAYGDGPLPIGEGQTISQPYIVALMTQLVMLKGGEKVLEIGTGSGYQSAVLAQIAREVHSIERHAELADSARERFKALGIDNIYVFVGDGSQGFPDEAPFDAILGTAAAPEVPPQLPGQLADGGRLVLPVGGQGGQTLERIRRVGDHWDREPIAPVAFVPLRGKYGWAESDWGE